MPSKRVETNLEQSLVLLHRATEAVNRLTEAELYLGNLTLLKNGQEIVNQHPEWYLSHMAIADTSYAELRGLAKAIGDNELWTLVNNRQGGFSTEWGQMIASTKHYAQKIHTRIAQLIEARTTAN